MTNKVHRRELAEKKSFTPPLLLSVPPYAKHSKNIVIHKRAREAYILPFGITKSQRIHRHILHSISMLWSSFSCFQPAKTVCVKNNNNVLLRAFISAQTVYGFGHAVDIGLVSVGSSEILCVRLTIQVYNAKCRLFHSTIASSTSPIYISFIRLLSTNNNNGWESGNLFELFAYKSGILKHSLCRGKIYLHAFRFGVFVVAAVVFHSNPHHLQALHLLYFGGTIHANTCSHSHFSFLSMLAYHRIICRQTFRLSCVSTSTLISDLSFNLVSLVLSVWNCQSLPSGALSSSLLFSAISFLLFSPEVLLFRQLMLYYGIYSRNWYPRTLRGCPHK